MLSQQYHCVGEDRYHKAPLWLAFFASLFPFKLALSFFLLFFFSHPLIRFLSPPLMCQILQLCPGLTQANPGQHTNGKQHHCTYINMTRQLFVYQPGVKHRKGFLTVSQETLIAKWGYRIYAVRCPPVFPSYLLKLVSLASIYVITPEQCLLKHNPASTELNNQL